MRILYLPKKYSLDLGTGEKYFCYPADNIAYLNSGVKSMPNLSEITDGFYNPTYNYLSSTTRLFDTTDCSFYRAMREYMPAPNTTVSGSYRSVWGTNQVSSEPGSSVDIIKNLYSTTAKTVRIAIIADNFFKIWKDSISDSDTPYINTNTVIIPPTVPDPYMFRWVHIFPVALNVGYNLFRFKAIQGGATSGVGNTNALGVLVLDNNISDLLNLYYPKSSWNILYTSDQAITEGVYYNYNTATIGVANYLGITPLTTAPPAMVSSWSINWGDTTSNSGTVLIDLFKQYSSSGTYTVTFTLNLTNGNTLVSHKSITVTA